MAAVLVGCSPREPIRIGFIGGVSGRVADLGISGRNGAALAIEMRNKAGGVNGRMVELIVEDDVQDEEVAKQAVARLIDRKVEAIIGPMTSAMAMACVPRANEAQMLMVSPTVSTTELSGRDDYFLRVISPTSEYAHKIADYQYTTQGLRRIAVAYDLRNKAYSASWLADYRAAFAAHGGEVVMTEPYLSGDDTDFARMAETLLRSQSDAVLVIANSVDTAMLAQQLRKRDAAIRIATSEWAATERLTELGGKAVEGMTIAQFLDRDSQAPAYQAFRKAYVERFALEPGFGGVTAFDAANVVLDALAAKKEGQPLKQAILERRVFAGVQSEIRFDAAGDARRETYMTTIRNGTFVRLP
ncbi:ABC transporter substrate-binding protein [Propionivibrio limicola]|uniref:ABC transporter substrate-binding protein n=1 Tax=Propionivibrio limicola TaxID=167645 RepID=UPI001B862B46|nr:ABC transporter substrate-binding protein [Propionivibrio limicola]